MGALDVTMGAQRGWPPMLFALLGALAACDGTPRRPRVDGASLDDAPASIPAPSSSSMRRPRVDGALPDDAPAPGSAPSASATPRGQGPAQARAARVVELGQPMTLHTRTRHTWRQLALGRQKNAHFQVNWQAYDPTPAPIPDEPQDTPNRCGPGMLEIQGEHLVSRAGRDDDDTVLLAQNDTCTLWRSGSRGIEGLCAVFDRARWLERQAELGRRPMRFCIDRYEYPNRHGEYPVVVSTYAESQAACAAEGKRLCTETEWTFACEGEEGLPYPYGYERDPSRCHFERKAPLDIARDFAPRMLPSTATALDRAFEGLRSGERPACRSPFDVFDLTGNVDEWTTTVRRHGYRMILKGGHSGYVRSRCRPATRGHGPLYVNHTQGFRCCRDAP